MKQIVTFDVDDEGALEDMNVDENEDEEEEEEDDLIDEEEHYEFAKIPQCNTDDKKTGVTFKGDTPEYLKARDELFKLFNKKGLILSINNTKLRILDNAKNKPIKIDVKPHKGVSGKVNITIFKPNKSGIAIDAELVHV